MQVGDLIKDKEYPDIGMIVEIRDRRDGEPYGVLCPRGKIEWFAQDYIEKECEVVSEKPPSE